MRLIFLIGALFFIQSIQGQNTKIGKQKIQGREAVKETREKSWSIESELRLGNSNYNANLSINSYFSIDADVDSARFGVESRVLYKVYEKPTIECLCDFSSKQEPSYKARLMLFSEAPILDMGIGSMYFRGDWDFDTGRIGIGIRGNLKSRFRWSSAVMVSNLGEGINSETLLIYKF